MIDRIEQLRRLVSEISTQSALGWASWCMHMDLMDAHQQWGLKAPYRQCLYLLGLMLATPEPKQPAPFTIHSWKVACALLELTDEFYAENFKTSGGEDQASSLKSDQRLGMLGYFLHHYGRPRIASVEQLRQRISDMLVPFDDAIRSYAGLSASDALRVAQWIVDAGQSDVDAYNEAVRHNSTGVRLEDVWRELPDWLLNREWHQMLADADYTSRPIPHGRVDRLFTVSLEEMRRTFGTVTVESFHRTFVSARGDPLGFTYPTEKNPAARKPVFALDSDRLFHPPGRFIYNAILDTFTAMLMAGQWRDRFLKRRDHVLETQAATCVSQFFGPSARVLPKMFEEDGHEHDLVVLWNDRMLVVEAKASPPTEPFRDPEKAWVRLTRAFHSDRGIQKAFEQARRLIRLAALAQPLRLFDKKGKLVVDLPVGAVKEAFGVCLTADDHGPAATDLSMLLKRDEGDQYPWAVTIFELQTILDGFAHVSIGPDRFFDFLLERQQLHGRVLPYDESEVAGIFIRYTTLKGLLPVELDAIVVLMPKDCDVFDQIYMEKQGGPEAVTKVDHPYKLNRVDCGNP